MKATTMSMHPEDDAFGLSFFILGEALPPSPGSKGRSKPPHF